ncbi:hypothetical protein NEOLEDRAFT_1097186 [Neolentinus lepideus HHB14362 ss-1]|uniref:Uncharacterized protein n=1 Tax=Neolentinus lepideus HHB14362 ss-1 TaxID=1314782 RepID=A0A165QQH6_9AGAM|nr:hypothetical protein NEOLEDRAFT_1097186 [Neolentinus lepideus HHB14362 ss-1]
MPEASALGPIDPASVPQGEEEKKAPWVVRKLVGSMTGRIVMSSYESLRAAGTSVVCLSPWGDSSPLLMPCIRFRDLVMHTVIAATGGTAAVAAPVMDPISDIIVSSLGDTVLVEVGLHTGFELTTKVADDLLLQHTVNHMIPLHSKRLETTAIKELLITLKYKHTVEDASLGFFRSSVHGDSSLFASVKDYLAVEKGWFSPYLFASGRRPIIPRTMKPDVVFCHGPFLSGDYKIGETLLNESASTISLAPLPQVPEAEAHPKEHHSSLSVKLPNLSNMFERSRTPSPEPALAPPPTPLQPRRLVILVVGLKPHRTFWTTSARPSESVIRYQLLNGCPAIVVPAKVGVPLLAWDTLTLEHLWKVKLPEESESVTQESGHGFQGIVNVMSEYLDLCIDWERVVLPEGETKNKKDTVKNAISLLVAAAVRSGNSKEVKKEVDKERSGIAIWRIL